MPNKYNQNSTIIDVVSGCFHTLMLTPNRVFVCGKGAQGQLGLGDTSDQDEPTYVDALRGVGVRQIACGSGHTVVLTTDGEVYTWGTFSQNHFFPPLR